MTTSKNGMLLGGLAGAALVLAPLGLGLGQADETDYQPKHSLNGKSREQATLARYEALDRDALASAEMLSEAFRSVAELAEPSVARIVAYTNRGKMTGSGFVIAANGFLVTNNHVVEPANLLFVEFMNEKRYPASVVGRDPLTDLAVLHIDAVNLEPVRFVTDEDPLEVGEWVVAVGCPLGLQQTVTAGIVSATERRLGIIGSGGRAGYEDFIQTDAAINRGNSGGPLLNLRGEVIGVNSAILSETGGSDGLGFAIPASLAVQIVDDLMEHQQVERGLLGVGIQDLTGVLAESYGLERTQRGALITSADEGMAAYKAGLRVEDVITEINDEPVLNAQELRSVVAMHKPAEEVRVKVLRNGRQRSVDVVLMKMEQTGNRVTVNTMNSTPREDLGMEIRSSRTRGSSTTGAFVRSLVPGSIADLAGMEEGDLILAVDSEPIGELASAAGLSKSVYLKTRISEAKSNSILRFTVQRGRSGTVIVGLQKP